MLNKSLFTAMIRSAGSANGGGCVACARSKPIFNINRFKEIAYKYDLISGKVNEVHYQPGAVDQFYHRYDYDAENRITDVYTSDNKAYIGHKNLEEHDAFYEYYKHGPLARAVIGQQQVQGIDYAYTLEGWLKGVNSTALTPVYDMGGDGNLVAQDAYSFGLNYFTGDYIPINANVSPFPGFSGLFPAGYSYKPLYNGNISAMTVNIGKLNNPLLYNYQYDQLNRLVAMDAFAGLDTSNNTWNALTTDNSYKERVAFDANGNILKYLRNGTTVGGTPLGMDSLNYKYFKNADGTLRNNRLRMVRDSVPAGNYPQDIDDQLPSVVNAADSNYRYDAIGNLIQDKAGNISNINWTVYGKISNIIKTDGTKISYTYDAAGNRISKTITPVTGVETTTWYVRDASGNTMAVYTATGSDSLHQTEQDLYGSSRLGLFNRNINADAALPTGATTDLIGNYYTSNFTRGNKHFEGVNHLGNVLLTFTDKKFGADNNGDEIVDYYNADVATAQDYYPFGLLEPGRNYSIANINYRYGFNGKENDKDIEASGQDYGMRIYDGRLGRFLSVDPITKEYPWNSTYAFAENDVIRNIDLDGAEKLAAMNQYRYDGSWGWFDRLKAIPNSAGKIYNSFISGTWNSGVDFFTSLGRGTLGKDLKNEGMQVIDNIKKSAAATYKYHTTTPASKQFGDFGRFLLQPEREEDALMFFGTAELTFAGKSNMLKVETTATESTAKYMSGNFIIGPKTLAKVTKHLENIGYLDEAGNKIMLARMEKIAKGQMKETNIDINFARHELRESEFMKEGMNQMEAHHAVLKEQNMYYPGYEKELYTQDALDASNEQWTREIKKK